MFPDSRWTFLSAAVRARATRTPALRARQFSHRAPSHAPWLAALPSLLHALTLSFHHQFARAAFLLVFHAGLNAFNAVYFAGFLHATRTS